MSTEYIDWPVARETFCVELAQFHRFLIDGLTSEEAAKRLRLPAEAAGQYARAIVRITEQRDVAARRALHTVGDALEPAPGLKAIQARAVPSPNGCQYCGLEEREHFQRWTDGAGWHGWTEPTHGQRLARMLARRAQKNETAPAGTGATSDDNEGNPL